MGYHLFEFVLCICHGAKVNEFFYLVTRMNLKARFKCLKIFKLTMLIFLTKIYFEIYRLKLKSRAMKQSETVSRIMTKNLVKLNLNDGLAKAESLFKKNKIRHLPVVNADKIVGMLSYSDLLRISYGDATDASGRIIENSVYDYFTLENVMTHKVTCVNTSDSIKHAAEILSKEHFRALPVIEHDKLVGIVTSTDIINYFLETCF
jgi:CBS domain-containing protein